MTEQEFSEIYQQHKTLVFRLALSYTRNIEEAEDITQEVFVKVFERIHQFEGNAQLKTWIYKITVTTSLDFLKAKKRKKRTGQVFSIFQTEGKVLEIKDFSPHPGITLENQELGKYLFAAIDQLAEPQRTAFYLSHVEGLGNIEISEVIAKSIGATESILQRAKAHLKNILADYYQDYRRNSGD